VEIHGAFDARLRCEDCGRRTHFHTDEKRAPMWRPDERLIEVDLDD